jgi:flagellar hook-basal body complex protein FliE
MSPIAPIDPTAAGAVNGLGSEWQIQNVPDISSSETGLPPVSETEGVTGESFGQMLSNQIDNLSALQADATTASQALADGTATDPLEAVQAVGKAQMSMQFASMLRTRGAEAMQEIFRTQI